MAEVKYNTITFLTNNPHGTFVTGDVLTLFIETDEVINTGFEAITGIPIPTTIGVKVKKNDVLITSGPVIGRPSMGTVQLAFHDPLICNGDKLIHTNNVFLDFPYLKYTTLTNSFCVVDAPVCDLSLSGVVKVTPASAQNINDGEIEIIATSSYSIEYSLGNFEYGTGQSSGVFTDLYPGDYRIYIKDANNCSVDVLVNVTFNDTFNILFRLKYTDFAGFNTKIDIQKRAYIGSYEEICGSDIPLTLQLRGEGSMDKFLSILSVQADINLMSISESQFIQLYTGDRNLFRVIIYKNEQIIFVGKVLPFIYSEIVKNAPYDINVVATDGLPTLKDFKFYQRDGLRYEGPIKLIKLIALCLIKTDLLLNIRVAINLYAEGMNTTDSDDPLDQAFVDASCFYLVESDATLEFVLQSILDAFGARIVQWDGFWNIIRVDELGEAYDYREFDSDGEYISNGTINPLINIDFPGMGEVITKAFPVLELRPGYGRIGVRYRLGLKENILRNGDFSVTAEFNPIESVYEPKINLSGWKIELSSYTLLNQVEIIDSNNVALKWGHEPELLSDTNAGNAFIQSEPYFVQMGTTDKLHFKIRYKISHPINVTTQFRYVKIRVMVKYGSYYLTKDGVWTLTENNVDFFARAVNGYLESEIEINSPTRLQGTSLTGMDLFVRVYHATPYFYQFKSEAALKAFPTVGLQDGYKTELRISFGFDEYQTVDYQYYYELGPDNTTGAVVFPNIIQPTDYHETTNNRRWILKEKIPITSVSPQTEFIVDYISLIFKAGTPIDTIVRSTGGERGNLERLDKDIIIGSSGSLIISEYILPGGLGTYSLQTTTVLSSDLIYSGWLRDVNGSPWDFWARDGISESDKLHGVLLRMLSKQYNRSWRLLRATLISKTQTIGMINSFREVNDGNRRYIPISVTLDDKRNEYSCELLELMGVYSDTDTEGGSDGSGTAPFTSAFTTGFGSGYN
jgi:hypothetical protein